MHLHAYDGEMLHPSSPEVPWAVADEFGASMPPNYRMLFDPRSIRQHAAISLRRGDRIAHVEVWRSLPEGASALCVVGDDRPGLLSVIAAALVSHGLDVVTALIFSRTTSAGKREAVDLVWVRRADSGDTSEIGPEEGVSITHVLEAILTGDVSIEAIARSMSVSGSALTSVDVKVDEIDDHGLAVLHVEAPDRPGLLLAIALEVFQQGAQIVRSLVRTADGTAFNRFELAEFSGAPLSPARRQQVREAVQGALSFCGSAP